MGELRLEWSSWVAGIGPALIAATIWTILLILVAKILEGSSKRSYQHGLAAGVIAYLGVLGATSLFVGVFDGIPVWVAIILLAPVIEESVRLLSANEVRKDPPSWLSFGLGYGLFEAGLKFGDALVVQLREHMHPVITALALTAPTIPLLLHTFLSVLVLALLRLNVALPVVWVAAVSLHALHNWSARFFTPTEWTDLAGSLLLRVAIFLALIAMLLPLAKRRPAGSGQMTSAP